MEGSKHKDVCELLNRVEEKGCQEGVDATRVESIRNIVDELSESIWNNKYRDDCNREPETGLLKL